VYPRRVSPSDLVFSRSSHRHSYCPFLYLSLYRLKKKDNESPFLDSHIQQLRSEINIREIDFEIQIDELLTTPKISCIQRALNYGITAVIYSSSSEWNTIIKSSNLSQKQIFDDTYISYIN
jgi:hypothetical protein